MRRLILLSALLAPVVSVATDGDVDAIKRAAVEVLFSDTVARGKKSPRAEARGDCDLQAWVDTDGRVVAVETTRCEEDMDQAWTTAVQGWRFRPHAPEGDAVPFTFRIGITSRTGSDTLAERPADPSLLKRNEDEDGPAARVKRRVNPAYPERAKQMNLEDIACRMRIFIDEQGTPYDIDFVACPEVFHDSARDALMQWRWYPTRGEDGAPVKVVFPLVIRYKLRNGRRLK